MTPPNTTAGSSSPEPWRVEEDRIRTAYAKRHLDSRYSHFNPGHLLHVQERERRVLMLLKAHGFANLQGKRILDVGCGTGQWILDLVKWGARPENLVGVDLLQDRIDTARMLCPSGVTFQCA